MDSESVLPVAVGLASGIAFVVMFSVYSNSTFDSLEAKIIKNDQIVMAIHNLRDAYRTNEPISFSVITKGISGNLCNYPEPSLVIVSVDEGKHVWYSPPTFQTAMRCDTIQGIDREWRFGLEGEELPYQSALSFDKKYDNRIAMQKAGLYRIIATFDDNSVDKEFTVISANTGMSVIPEKVPEGTKIEIEITDSGNEGENVDNSVESIAFDHELTLDEAA